MQKNKEINIENLEITDAGAEGVCIGRHEGAVVFVPYAVPGDVVDVTAKKKHAYYQARITRFVKLSPHRVEPRCAHFGTCGGCKWQQMEYAMQLHYKQKQVFDHFTRIGKFPFPEIRPIIAANEIFDYRDKIEYTFSDRKWLSKEDLEKADTLETRGLGFHLPGMFDKILDISHCHLHSDTGNRIRNSLKEFGIKNDYTFWNARRQEGLLRNLILRRSTTGERMAILVFSEWNGQSRKMMEFVRETFPEITSLMYVVNNKANDSITDLEVMPYAGKDHLTERMRNLQFKVSPLAFYQTNPEQAFKLYSQVEALAGIEPDELVYDLYTGTGTIALFVAGNAKKVVGIEYVEPAVADARVNAELNSIGNVEFVAGDMAKILTDDFVARHGHPDVILTDPPRAGMHPKVVDQLLKIAPERIVYVSCNSATQARDIALLAGNYEVTAVQPVDMFPHTHHVENIALLTRRP